MLNILICVSPFRVITYTSYKQVTKLQMVQFCWPIRKKVDHKNEFFNIIDDDTVKNTVSGKRDQNVFCNISYKTREILMKSFLNKFAATCM